MTDASTLTNPAAYHILSYGTLLGSEVFQSFVAGIVSYRALPRPAFSTLQTALFPVYFSMQTALPLIMAITYPGGSGKTLTGGTAAPSSISGVLAEQNRYTVLLPLATIFATSAANLLVVGPQTTKTMRERKHQETRDGKKSYDPAPHSQAMQKLNRQFGRLHGMSSLLNMAGCLATVYYGFTLAERIH